MASCKCKVGSCPRCPSPCKRCGCECDGKTIAEKISRKPGRQKGSTLETKSPKPVRRAAAEAARDAIATSDNSQLQSLLVDTCTHIPLDSASAQKTDLLSAFGMGETERKKLPPKKMARGDVALSHQVKSYTVAVLRRIVHHCIHILAPGHAHTLIHLLGHELAGKETLPAEKQLNRMIETTVMISQLAPRGSIQGRVARSIIAKGLSKKKIEEIGKTYEGTLAGGAAYNRAMDDFQFFTTEVENGKAGAMIPKKHSRERFDRDGVDKMLKFILSPRNIGFLSWGKRLVPLGATEVIELPSLTRKMIATHMLRDYKSYCENNALEDSQRVSEKPFRQVLNAITNGDERLLQAVDYVVGRLVNDPCTKLQTLVEYFSTSAEQLESLSRHLSVVRNFLKVQLDDHLVTSDDEVATHCIRFALSKPGEAPEVRNGHCPACEFPAAFLKEVEECIRMNTNHPPDIVNDACRVIEDFKAKFELYMAHRARVVNAQVNINKILTTMENDCGKENETKTGLVVIDWKMKFQPRGSRETTLEHFGKRGIGWHGALMHVFVNEQEEDSNGTIVDVVRRKTVYCDQIMCGSNKQDVPAVVAMLESFLWQIKAEVPEVEQIILQSDNASCYQSQMLLMLIPILNCMNVLPIVRYIHTGTQDGKGLIDAHFARGTAQVTTYLQTAKQNKVKYVATPAGLARSLASYGGIQNSFVQLLRVHRPTLEALVEHCKPYVKSAQSWFSRCDDAFFITPENGWKLPHASNEEGLQQNVDPIEFLQGLNSNFKMRLYAYSGIGEGVEFTVDFSNKKFCPSHVASNTTGTDLESNVPQGEDDEEQEEENEVEDNGEEDNEALEVENLDMWNREKVEGYHSVPQAQMKSFLTRTSVLRCSHLVHVKVGGAERKSERRTTKTALDGDSGRRDLVAYAVRKTVEILEHSDDIAIRDGKDDMPEYLLSVVEPATPRQSGWARRVHGKMYGVSYIKDYKSDIKEMFEQGRIDPTKQMNSSMMLEFLRRKYPGRFTLPGEIEIRGEINTLFQQQKQQERAEKRARDEGNQYTASKKTRLDDSYIAALESYLEEDPNLKPLEGLLRLQAEFRDPEGKLPDDFPEEAKIRSKISSMKTMAKKKQQRDTL